MTDRLAAVKQAYIELDSRDQAEIRNAVEEVIVGIARRRPGVKSQVGPMIALEVLYALGRALNRDVDNDPGVCYSDDRGEHGS